MPDAAATPLLEQYEGVKARYPGHLVLFRVGDFYETFGDDAKLLAKELEVTLTARSADAQGVRTPMAGVPHHAVDSYLGRLVERGYKVALCDQVEDARLAKGLVRREVTRVVTPGTAVEERLLPGPESNFLVSLVVPGAEPPRYAAVDVTTGEWHRGRGRAGGAEGAAAAIAPFAPRELLLAVEGDAPSVEAISKSLRREFPRLRIEASPPAAPAEAWPKGLPADLSASEREADARLAAYVRATQPRLLPYLEVVNASEDGRRLALDAKTLRHLEISRPMNPDDPGGPTLLRTWDESVTASGRRTIAFWLRHPLAEVAPIVARQDAVAWLVGRGASLLAWRRELARIADIARISARVAGRRLRPAELAAVSESLAGVAAVAGALASAEGLPERLADLTSRIDPLPALSSLLAAALPGDRPPEAEGEIRFRPGHIPELDRLGAEEAAALAELGALERDEQSASGIRSLKIGYNQVFGYYFEISKANLSKAPAHFRRKQTLSGGERYTSDALEALQDRIRSAQDAAATVRASAWEELLAAVESYVPALYRLSRAIGELDALVAFAHLASERGHVRPVVDDSGRLLLRDARHPVLDRTLSGRFVPNDTDLDRDGARLLVLTGPNMSGKSTYMRQIGLSVVLAQAGAFLPARYAQIGIVSSLATRMGFTDEIGRGKSSFMVEMSEVAEILASADERSLVLLDEVGRGTSTFDGLALAWATLRHLNNDVRCRTVLATHYHQLTELVGSLPGARNAHLAVKESEGEVVFLHRLVPGSTDKSYGIHVARLAGLPDPLLAEAERLLHRLEEEGPRLARSGRSKPPATRYTQAVLLADEKPGPAHALAEEIRGLDPDRLTPMEALRWIVEARRRFVIDPTERTEE